MVVGGGINGAGIARATAGTGLSVLLCEQNDLANATSSASTKLIHGGLRYLESWHFGLVRKSLAEREVLLNIAPHIIHPLRFVLPHNAKMRPAWMLRLGLMFYDHLSKRVTLPKHRSFKLSNHTAGKALAEPNTIGFEYSDCRVDDARLVILNAMAAAEHGAEVLTRTRCAKLAKEGDGWVATLVSRNNPDTERLVRCKIVVNATGPWVADFRKATAGDASRLAIRLVKGSHIVIPKLYDHEAAYIFQQSDNRIVFAIPYETDFTLIGTTESNFSGDASAAEIAADEIDYLLGVVNQYFKASISPAEIVWSFAGVRPLIGDETTKHSKLSRDYELNWTGAGSKSPMLSIYGGKITTYRKLTEQAMRLISNEIGGLSTAWSSKAPLPGGDLGGLSFERFNTVASEKYSWMPQELCHRYSGTYGANMDMLIGDASSLDDLGQHFGSGLYEKEVVYLMQCEWAQTVEDILWRRTKLGLRFSQNEAETLSHWLRSAEMATT